MGGEHRVLFRNRFVEDADFVFFRRLPPPISACREDR